MTNFGMMNEDEEIVKIYFVSDPKGLYVLVRWYRKKFKTIKKFYPKSSNWAQGRLKKDVYLFLRGYFQLVMFIKLIKIC